MASRAVRAGTAKKPGGGSPKQVAAAKKAGAASHAAHPKGSLTPAQLTADRANLAIARSVVASRGKKVQTPAQLVAERANMAKARAAEVAAHPKGHQTAKQLAAERANLAKARAARKKKGGGSRRFGRGHRAQRPIGTPQITFTLSSKPRAHRLTGRFQKFQKSISSGSYNQRTAWRKGRSHHFQKRIHLRRKNLVQNGKWRRTKGRLTSR